MIGILAPYDRSETTLAALRIANLAVACGAEVRYVVVGRREHRLHPFWDQRVRSSSEDGVYIASQGCHAFVHFQTSPSLRKMTELVAPKAKHILVPPWHQLRLEDAAFVPDHHAVVCASSAHCTAVKETIFQGNVPETCKVTWTKFDAGTPPVKRHGTVEFNKLKVCLHANYSVIDFCGPLWLHVIAELLDEMPRMDFTLLANKSWPEQDRKMIRDLKKNYPKRFTYKRQGDLDSLNSEFLVHDWAIIPWTRCNVGIMAMRALACGTPVVAFDVPPFSELISKRSGVLLPCELQVSRFNAPTAVPNLRGVLTTLLESFESPNLLRRLQTEDWALPKRDDAFTKFWAEQLDLH